MAVDPFSGILGHDGAKRVLLRALETPHHAYLLVGGDGLGTHALAERFVRALTGHEEGKSLAAHPDIAVLKRELGEDGTPSKTTIAVEAVRDLRERLMRRPVLAPRTVAYLPEADRLNEAGANALLKSLEEPPAGAVFVLAAEDESRLPATVKSRVVLLRLSPVAAPDIDAWLAERKVPAASRPEAVRMAAGHPGKALRWLEREDVRLRAAEAARLTDRLLSARSAGEAIAAFDAEARRADTAGDAAWESALSDLMQALRERFAEQPRASLELGHALASARRAVGGPISPRLQFELSLVRSFMSV